MQEITQACAIAFGQAVRRARKAKKLSQEQFAFACDLDRSYVGQVERGENNISLETLLHVARGLRCKPSKILDEAGY
jgi:transcriptional regulator with XRE-family HTH domain